MVHVTQPGLSTTLIIISLFAMLFLTARPRKHDHGLSTGVTQEIKGLAVLMIIVSHIGFFLVDDRSFLYPLSIMAGVGVNLFLLLSGYGLTLSQSAKPLARLNWYRKRLPKLYIPMIIVVLLVVLLDIAFTNRGYSIGYVVRSLLGWFPQADISLDLNSPLWYFSLIIFYYLLFPLLFWRKHAWLTALGLFLASLLLVDIARRTGLGVTSLYRTHIAAFPLGVLMAWLSQTKGVKDALQTTGSAIGNHVRAGWQRLGLNWLAVAALVVIVGYFARHSHVGQGPIEEQFFGIFTSLLIILMFSVKRIAFRFLSFIGFFSYELYLLHWPLLSRHDFLYSWLPGWGATIVWLILLLAGSWLLQQLSDRALKLFQRPRAALQASQK